MPFLAQNSETASLIAKSNGSCFLKKVYFVYLVYLLASVCMCVHVPHRCPQKPESDIRDPGAGVTNDCEPDVGSGTKPQEE